MVYGKVFVAGGSKGVGRIVIDKLVERGSEVVALVRREDAKVELEAIKGGSNFDVVLDYCYSLECRYTIDHRWQRCPSLLQQLV